MKQNTKHTISEIIDFIKQDIKYQETHLCFDFEKDKPIKWRIEGMKSLIKKIELFVLED